jgi:hypothetical protein
MRCIYRVQVRSYTDLCLSEHLIKVEVEKPTHFLVFAARNALEPFSDAQKAICPAECCICF